MLVVPTSMLLRGNIWFIANYVIKLHQRVRRLCLQRNQSELMKDIIFVGHKQRALMEGSFFYWKSISFTSRCNDEMQPWASIGHRGDASSIWHQVWVRHLWSSTNSHRGLFLLSNQARGRKNHVAGTVRRNNNGHPILCSSTKIDEEKPGYGDTHRCLQKYKKGI